MTQENLRIYITSIITEAINGLEIPAATEDILNLINEHVIEVIGREPLLKDIIGTGEEEVKYTAYVTRYKLREEQLWRAEVNKT